MDPEILEEKISVLKRENKELKDILKHYKKRLQELEEQIHELLKIKRKYKNIIEQAKMWIAWLRKGHVKYTINDIERCISNDS